MRGDPRLYGLGFSRAQNRPMQREVYLYCR
nr:MAG TPA: hypothetical protein [Caudoviricetes sp.]